MIPRTATGRKLVDRFGDVVLDDVLGIEQEATLDTGAIVAKLVESAGGEIVVTDRTLLDDPPELLQSRDPITSRTIYRTVPR